MSVPNNQVSQVTATGLVVLAPDSVSRKAGNLLIDYEQGGVALNDASQGLRVKTWRATYDARCGSVVASAYPYMDETPLFAAAGVTELSLAFDQNMHATVAFVAGGQARLYWYDSLIPGVTTTALAADVRSPFVTMDDKRDVATHANTNDILLFYIRGNAVYWRQQRDRFTIERQAATFVTTGLARIVQAGMTTTLNLSVRLTSTEPITVTPSP